MKTKHKKQYKAIDFGKHLASELKDPIFRKRYNEYGKQLEIAYRILELRKKEGLSQAQLAGKIGTSQGNIARMESGQQNFTTDTLYRVAEALGRDLRVEFVK